MLKLNHNDYEVWIIDEPDYSLGSTDNVYLYKQEHTLSEDNHFASKYAIKLVKEGRILRSCILAAPGGATEIHAQSAKIVGESIYIAVGNRLCSLALPSLNLQWQQRVDFATCFGVYFLPKENCLITRGECEISRITLNGRFIWSKSGKDIFSEGFLIKENHIEVTDFNHETYSIILKDGQINLITG